MDNVSRFELIIRRPLSEGLRKLEVVRSKGSWDCYQIRLIDNGLKGLVNDSTRKFLKKIPSAMLENLLTIIAMRDTGVKAELFKINKTDLAKYINTVTDMPPTAAQRAEFVNALRSDSILNNALYKVVHPRPMDDRTYYGITIITRKNSSFTISALSFAAVYYLPWKIGDIESYNPDISRIFEFIYGQNAFEQFEKHWLYRNIAQNIYWQLFNLKFNLEDLRSLYPASYNLINETFTPWRFIIEKNEGIMYCWSSRLPRFAQLLLAFHLDDTATVKRYKRYEDTLVSVFKKENFLFDHLSKQAGSRVIFTPGRMGDVGKWYFRDIKKYFSGIENYDYKKSELIEVGGTNGPASRWLLLPDNTLLLMELRLDAGDDTKFIDLPPAVLDELHRSNRVRVCIVFDASGKILHNYGAADMHFY